MDDSESLDIRYPIGGLFLVLGALLVPYGLFARSAVTAAGPNIDLWWGAVMLVFGALLLALARAARRRTGSSAGTSPDSHHHTSSHL